MPIRTSSKLPSSHPSQLLTINPASLTTYWVKSNASESNPVYLGVPQGSDLNGRRFTVYISGRYTVTTGASGHIAKVQIYAKNGTLACPSLQIAPASGLTNAVLPFYIRQSSFYDAAAQILFSWIDLFFGNASSYASAVGNSATPLTGIAPSDLNFSAALILSGTAAPTSATFEVFEFVLA